MLWEFNIFYDDFPKSSALPNMHAAMKQSCETSCHLEDVDICILVVHWLNNSSWSLTHLTLTGGKH